MLKESERNQSIQDSLYNRRFKVVFILLGFSILLNIYSLTSINQKGTNNSNMLSRVQSLVNQAEEYSNNAQWAADRAEGMRLMQRRTMRVMLKIQLIMRSLIFKFVVLICRG